jgi:hypothetical protein
MPNYNKVLKSMPHNAVGTKRIVSVASGSSISSVSYVPGSYHYVVAQSGGSNVTGSSQQLFGEQIILSGSSGGGLKLYEGTSNGAHSLIVKAPDAITTDKTLTLPDGPPTTSGYALVSTTAGVMSWAAFSGGNSYITGLAYAPSTQKLTATLSDSSTVLSNALTAFGNQIWLSGSNSGRVHFHEASANGNNYVQLKGPTDMGANNSYIISLPTGDGSNGQVMARSTGGQLVWADNTSSNYYVTGGTYDAGNDEIDFSGTAGFPAFSVDTSAFAKGSIAGTATYVPYFTASTALTGTNTFTWDNANGVLSLTNNIASSSPHTGHPKLSLININADGYPTMLEFYKNSASPSIFDLIGYTRYAANNSAGTKTTFVEIATQSTNVTAGDEGAEYEIFTMKNGTKTKGFRTASGSVYLLNTEITGTLSTTGVATLGNNSVTNTQTAGNNSTRIATTAFVTAAVAAAGGGDVSKAGTPVDNQLAVWTGANTIEGTTNLTYDGTDLDVDGTVNISKTTSEKNGFMFRGRSDTGFWEDNTDLFIGTPNSAYVMIDSNNNNTDEEFAIFTNNTTVGSATRLVTVEESGNVGIGTGSPAKTLHIKKDAGHFRISSADYDLISMGPRGDSGSNLDKAALNMMHGDGSSKIYFDTGGDSYIKGAGNLGIQTSSPNFTLDVVGTTQLSGNSSIVGTLSTTGVATLGDNSVTNTQTAGNNSTRIATTAFVTAAVAAGGGTIGGSITDNQVAFGASTSNSIEGSADLTYDGYKLTIGRTAGDEARGVRILDDEGTETISLITSSSDHGLLYLRGATGGNSIYLDANGGSYLNGGYLGIGTTGPDNQAELTIVGKVYQQVDANGNINYGSGSFAHGSNIGNYTGYYSSMIGFQAGYYISGNAHRNVAVGYRAMYGATTGQTAQDNVAIGASALYDLGAGNFNVAVGSNAGADITAGEHNMFFGVNAGRLTTIGHKNVAIGTEALYDNVHGDFNIAIGSGSLYNTTPGDGYGKNIAIGTNAGAQNTTGTGNIFIGDQAGNDTTWQTLNRKLVIADSATTSPLIYGDFGGFITFNVTGNAPNSLTVTANQGSADGILIDSYEPRIVLKNRRSSGNDSVAIRYDNSTPSLQIRTSRDSYAVPMAIFNDDGASFGINAGAAQAGVTIASGASYSFDNTTTNRIYRGSGVSFWDSTESYRLQGNTTSGYLQLDLNKISLVRNASSAASAMLTLGDGGTYDQFSILEDQRGSTATNGFLKLRAKKTGNFGYRKISLAAISGSTTSELMVDSISTNEALRFDTNSKSHALDIAKAGYVSIGAAVSTTDALYVNGNTTINGVLSATAKSFNIPHPLYKDKRLVHGSLEGPEHAIYIRGTIETEEKGCLVELPEYWSAMCEDYTVQLTPHGPYTVYIKEKLKDKVMIECSQKKFKFDYYIVGARTDETLEVVQDA